MTAGRRATLLVTSLATAMLLLDVTIVYVALPAIQADLDASFSEMQWVIDAYTLALAATLLGAGVLADRFGRRGLFIGGLVVFSAFSVLCGAASSPLVLDLSRAAQGLGAAALFATSLALLSAEFPGRDRSRALGIWGAVTGLALALGPLIGGLVVDGLSWRWIFLVNAPIGVALLALTFAAVPESRGRRDARLDLRGIAVLGVSTTLLVLALVRGNEDGWSSTGVLGCFAGAVVFGLAFLVLERRAPEPLFPSGVFRLPAFSGTALVSFGQSVVIYPLLLFLAIYFQSGLGLSPSATGIRMLPMTLAILAVAPFTGRLTSRLPLRAPLSLGLLLFGVAALLMAGVEVGDEWTGVLLEMTLAGVAVGLISPALAAAMVAVLPVEDSGRSSGINNTFRQLGIAIGIAGLGAIFDSYVAGTALASPSGIVDGLNAVLVASGAIAFATAAAGWFLIGDLRMVRDR